MKDEIIQEVWKAKDELASRHGYDLKRLAIYIQSKEKSSGHAMVDLRARGSLRRVIVDTVSH